MAEQQMQPQPMAPQPQMAAPPQQFAPKKPFMSGVTAFVSSKPGVVVAILAVMVVLLVVYFYKYGSPMSGGKSSKASGFRKRGKKAAEVADEPADEETERLIETINSA